MISGVFVLEKRLMAVIHGMIPLGPVVMVPLELSLLFTFFFKELSVGFVSIFVSHHVINIYYFPRIFYSEVERTCYSHHWEEELIT